MDLTALQTEVAGWGFDYLSTTRVNYFLNRAYQELCEEEDWSFLEATTSGAAPLAISDLRTIESVTDTTQRIKLWPLDRRHILDSDYSLTSAGAPTYYYVTGGNTVAVYPFTANSLSVRYWKVPTALSSGADTPVLPARFHHAIVTGALVYAYLDSDNAEMASVQREEFELAKQRMRDSLLSPQHDAPGEFVVSVAEHLDA